MKTRREARIWVYTHCVAPSLRKRAAALRASDITDGPITPAGVARVRAEMVALADWLERRAARLTSAAEENTVEP